MKCHLYTGEGLLVGWADVCNTQWGSSDVSGPFHANDFYSLIQPTMRLWRWPFDVAISYFGDKEQEWQDFLKAEEEIRALNLKMKIAATGELVDISCFCIEEVNGVHIFHGNSNTRSQFLCGN